MQSIADAVMSLGRRVAGVREGSDGSDVNCNHGSWSVADQTCVCDEGWTNDTDQDVLSGKFVYCTSQAATAPPEGNPAALERKSLPKKLIIIIVAVAVGVALIAGIATFCLCRRHRKKRRAEAEEAKKQRNQEEQRRAMLTALGQRRSEEEQRQQQQQQQQQQQVMMTTLTMAMMRGGGGGGGGGNYVPYGGAPWREPAFPYPQPAASYYAPGPAPAMGAPALAYYNDNINTNGYGRNGCREPFAEYPPGGGGAGAQYYSRG